MGENSQFDFQEAESEEVAEKGKNRRIKNLTALAILLGGLFTGSLFVDFIQLVRGQGFSSRKLQEAGVLEAGGKTWVAYNQPIIKAQVLSSADCSNCKIDEVLVWLRRLLPTIEAEKIDINSDAGKKMAGHFGIRTIPGFVFLAGVEKTDFYQKAPTAFTKKGSSYVLNGTEIGIPVGKYLETPAIEDGDVKIGKDDAPVKLVEFSDFQCPYCKLLHESIKQVLADMGDRVELVYKYLPLNFHAQAQNAALAAACANEQGKFENYADKLFASQSDWGKTRGTAKFKAYAMQMGLNASQFNKCLDDKKYQSLVDEDKEEASKFGITGTPAIFVNGQFKNGAVSLEELKAIIEGELGE